MAPLGIVRMLEIMFASKQHRSESDVERDSVARHGTGAQAFPIASHA
jgi:hypothetical protein